MGQNRMPDRPLRYSYSSQQPSRVNRRRVKWPRVIMVFLILFAVFGIPIFIVSVGQKEFTESNVPSLELGLETKAEPQALIEPVKLDVPLINQMLPPELYNGCEVTSLAMILQYAGYNVTKTELADRINKLPVTHQDGLKGNPNYGFVGDIDGSNPGYFVYHGPIADLAKKYAGDRVQDLTGADPSKLYEKIAEGVPVWVITTTSFGPVSNMETWDTPHGKVKVSMSEHSVVVTGYSEKYVWLNNPYGHKNQKVDRQQFEKSWIEMGRQAVVVNPKKS
ncbi:MAG TPA: C39 family peptidase [Bacillales bacterium]|nr:C39 family peptidase [Bacillales bacterium]